MNFPRDIPSAVSNREAAQLVDLAGRFGSTVLELGSHFGFSTVVLAWAGAWVHSVDWHLGDQHAGPGSLETFLWNLDRYGVRSRVLIHIGGFEDILPFFAPGRFDGVFLDGSHDLDSVLSDTAFSWELVRPGGWVAWHDYGRFDVKEAVDGFLADHDARLEGVVDSLAWTRRGNL